MNNDNKVETAMAGVNCWASYAVRHGQAYFSVCSGGCKLTVD